MDYLKRTIVAIFLMVLMGCSGKDIKPVIEISDQFKVGQVSLTLLQRTAPKITYHTEAELQNLLAQKIKALLEQRGLLSHQPSANYLAIQVVYQRKFLNEQALPTSGALAYPTYDYDIKVISGMTELKRVSQKNRVFKGRFIMNIDVLAGRLKKRSDEVVFIDGLAKEIVRSVEKLKG